MSDVFKLQYGGNTLTYPGWDNYVGYTENYPTGTYTRTLYFNSYAESAGNFSDSIYNYDLLRITTMPCDPINNKLAAPNVPFYIEPDQLKTGTVHTQTFGFDNTATVNTTGWFIWADNKFSASEDGKSFVTVRNGAHFRVGGTQWNTTGTPGDGATGTYLNYIRNIYKVEGIIYNGNRELLYSGNALTGTANLSKSITGNGYNVIQIKHSVNIGNNFDGEYISHVNSTRFNTRDSISMPYGGDANWYNGSTVLEWSNNYKTVTCLSAKAFQKSLTSNAAMTGNYAMGKADIRAIWGVK